ncbi:MAG: 23S rRNA (guanosine(2251)-2'-O)-methyltransferase RlmB [Anaerolineaceae bacterium]|nr:23S rRNA (guanosine(2251)-2'-O)-methyltransferase RlmB [Anaerolineaceae bacterium]
MSEWITGRNPAFEVLRAKRRQVSRLWLAQGIKPQGHLEDIVNLARSRKIPIEVVKRNNLDGIDPHHQGLALEVGGYPYSDLEAIIHRAESRYQPIFVLILDLIQDPQNLGTLLRSAEAFGVHGVILPTARAASVTPAVVNASSGATEMLLIAQHNIAQAMDRLKEAGGWMVGLEGSPEAQPPQRLKLDGGIGLVIGNEGQGLRRLVREKCDLLMKLPMQGQIDSLNAAVAGSIALFLARQARS